MKGLNKQLMTTKFNKPQLLMMQQTKQSRGNLELFMQNIDQNLSQSSLASPTSNHIFKQHDANDLQNIIKERIEMHEEMKIQMAKEQARDTKEN